MSKNNSNFFQQKKEWSKTKDELLGCYLKPYFTKILKTGAPVIYIDCFAGAGKYQDGSYGSPLIALENINSALDISKTQGSKKNVSCIFIEKQHADLLLENITSYNNEKGSIHTKVIKGTHENEIINILQRHIGCNIFLYVDPFGVKPLDFSIFEKIAHMKFTSIEILINFNSNGFFRWACSATDVQLTSADSANNNENDDFFSIQTPNELQVSKVAGGDYWKRIVRNYRKGWIKAHTAESQIALLYKRRLMKIFTYALDIPLREKEGRLPKYRMVHACHHYEGCYLMAENMQKRSSNLYLKIQKEKTDDLFKYIAGFSTSIHDGDYVEPIDVRKDILSILQITFQKIRYKELVAKYITEKGLINNFRIIQNHLSDFEKEGIIRIERDPAYTKTGKPSSFWSDKNNEKVYIIPTVHMYEKN